MRDTLTASPARTRVPIRHLTDPRVLDRALIEYLLRDVLFKVGCSPYTIIPAAAFGIIITTAIVFWLLGLEKEDRTAFVALRRR